MNNPYDSGKVSGKSKKLQLPLIVLTAIFTIIFIYVADRGLTFLLNIGNESIYTYNYSLGIFGLILVIPAVLLSLGIIKGLDKNGYLNPLLAFLEKAIPKMAKLLTKLFKITVKAVIFTVKGIALLVMLIVNSISPSSGSHGSRGYFPSGRAISEGSNNKQESKKEAQWQAKQKQKEADVAWKHAKDQAEYNPNTIHMDKRLYRANAKQREANAEAKKFRKL
ncbi:hypothetical protein EPH95_14915 [Salicibibacter halophilus]|uniref:Uncharacterized protein n=1 Tax=Salicibibacter halophilus TaxID=2502791 RepID=A0A514LKJ6_9BACI|nr:hypothetical protein [Salicibibacter halophilus]QDI92323.1 hypothetical protein EPH95_14915 [Salicibibacter halophilus]